MSVASEKERGPERYLAYLARFRALIRYFAYTSDVGEAFRPIVNPKIVTTAYAISWTYVIGDVSYIGYKCNEKGFSKVETARAMIERALFQSIASMALPAFTIHTQVKIFKHVFKKLGKFTKWGPTCMGFATIPFLPYLFDYPVERGLELAFDKFWKIEGKQHHEHEH